MNNPIPSKSVILLERLARILQNDTHAGGLKPTQWEALRYLARANRFSRVPSALTAYLGMTKGTVSQTFNALERKALIKKRPSPDDKRVVMLEVTPIGTMLLKHDPFDEFETAIAGMPKTERGVLENALDGIVRRLLVARDGRPFGVCHNCHYFQRDAKDGGPHLCRLLGEPLSTKDSEQICVEQEA